MVALNEIERINEVTKNFTPEIRAYLAGILEYATFTIKRDKRPDLFGDIKYKYSCFIELRIYSEALADWIGLIANASVGILKPLKNSTRSRWEARFAGPKAFAITREILPYLITRRDHGLIFLEFEKTGNYKGNCRRVPDKISEQRLILYDAIRKLNEQCNRRCTITEEKKKLIYKLQENIYHNNIFDVFDGVFTEERSKMAKSIFDDFLK